VAIPRKDRRSDWMFRPVTEDDSGIPGVCKDGGPHRFDGVECLVCGAEPDTEDRSTDWHAADEDHPCFYGCRHISHRKDD
jgi:hypothetical protein